MAKKQKKRMRKQEIKLREIKYNKLRQGKLSKEACWKTQTFLIIQKL